MNRTNYVGQQFGNRIIIKNDCQEEDWIRIKKPIPKNISRYYLSKCLNCQAILPVDIRNLKKQPPKRCIFCSNIGNHYNIETNRNTWADYEDYSVCNVDFKNEIISFYIDKNDKELVNQYIWRISQKRQKYYVVTGSSKKNTLLYLHQLLLPNKNENLEIDHIDGNSLNNRRSNLRLVNRQENIDNIKATRIDNQLGVRGVSYNKKSKKYCVDFSYHGTRYYVKDWDTKEEAIFCRYCFEKEFGLNLIVNNPLVDLKQLPLSTQKQIHNYVLEKISRK